MSLLYILLFLTPFHNDPRLGEVLLKAGIVWITPLKILGLCAAAGALLAPVPRDAAPRLSSPLVGLFLLFAIVPVIATLAQGLSVPGGYISQLLSSALLFVAMVPLIRTSERAVKVARVLVVGFAFGSLWVYKQHFIGHESRPWGLENDSDYEALMLLVPLPMAFWMARNEDSRWWRSTGLMSGVMLIGAVVLTQTRGGIVAAGVMGLLAVLRAKRKVIGVALLAGTALVIFNFAPTGLVQRFRSIQFTGQAHNGPEQATRIRLELLKAGLRMMEAHPILGVGILRFSLLAQDYNPELAKLTRSHYIAHNTFVQIGSEEGIPALLLFLAMLGVALRDCRAAQRSSEARLRALGFATEISLVGVSVAALSISVEFMPFCIIVSFAHCLRQIALPAAEPARAGQTAMTTGTSILKPALPARSYANSGGDALLS